MEESDSEAENDNDVPARSSDVPYPLEGKYIDAGDKARILAMPQVEREMILGQRAEEQQQAQWQAELARRARENEMPGASSNRKRKADSIEPDDAERRSSRQKVKGKTSDKLEAYKREREQRDQQRQRNDDRRNGRRRSSSQDSRRSLDVDADGESEVEYSEEKAPREEAPAQLNHFEYVRVDRNLFSQTCYTPGFEEAMTGAFARIGTGQDSQGRTLYKMAQIKGMYGLLTTFYHF
jgi:RNA polymerase-associated protein RTF1